MNTAHLLEKTLAFLASIGIETKMSTLEGDACFLPGLAIERGAIIIDNEKLLYPGDVLHEAAHIAVVPAAERPSLNGAELGKRRDAPAEEMMAIAWSYAACIHLGIDPAFVFHTEGYQHGGNSIVENFEEGRYIGVPVLEWLGMTTTKEPNGNFPMMIKWLRD
jgi:hypothetical protein